MRGIMIRRLGGLGMEWVVRGGGIDREMRKEGDRGTEEALDSF